MRRQFSREFKLSVLQELESASLTEVCRKHSLAASTGGEIEEADAGLEIGICENYTCREGCRNLYKQAPFPSNKAKIKVQIKNAKAKPEDKSKKESIR